jgi:hypothetical protein
VPIVELNSTFLNIGSIDECCSGPLSISATICNGKVIEEKLYRDKEHAISFDSIDGDLNKDMNKLSAIILYHRPYYLGLDTMFYESGLIINTSSINPLNAESISELVKIFSIDAKNNRYV